PDFPWRGPADSPIPHPSVTASRKSGAEAGHQLRAWGTGVGSMELALRTEEASRYRVADRRCQQKMFQASLPTLRGRAVRTRIRSTTHLHGDTGRRPSLNPNHRKARAEAERCERLRSRRAGGIGQRNKAAAV